MAVPLKQGEERSVSANQVGKREVEFFAE